MAVLGASPALTYLPATSQAFSGNGSQTVFTLNTSVGANTDIEVVVDNVQQSPYDSSYTVGGTTLTFSEAPASGTNNVYVVYSAARIVATTQMIPDNGSVTSAKLSGALTTPGALTVSGQLKATSSMLNGGETVSWASSLFTNIVKGTGDAGSRTTAFVSGLSTGSASTWYGNINGIHAAIDSVTAGGLSFWSNNGTSWFQVMDYSHAGALNLYGGNGGTALNLKNGGDLTIWDSTNTYRGDIWCDGGEVGMITTSGYVWVEKLANRLQHCSYDRQWNNEPSITVCNNTGNGSQATFRIHGAPGVSGADYSVNFVCDGTVSGSDRRKKTNIQPITNALDKVKRLQGVSYSLMNSELQIQDHMSDAEDGRKFGWIAQDAQVVVPELTKEFEGPVATPKENGWCDGFAVDYQGGVPLLNEAIKEQQVIIEQLLARIEALENK
jgi:hypothetical protein